jgi:hypothetical protein
MYPRRHIMEDILSELADSIESMPSDEEMARLRTLCVEMVEKQREADETEAKLKDLKREIYELQHKKIPEVSAEIGMDRVGLPDLNVDVVVAPYYKANISSSWDEDRRQAAFDYLTEIEVGDIIRTEVSYSLGPESMELAEAIHTAVVEYASMDERSAERPGAEDRHGRPVEHSDLRCARAHGEGGTSRSREDRSNCWPGGQDQGAQVT